MALYRAGEWEEALAALRKSDDIREEGDACTYFFIAMTRHKLGQEDARAWYDKAVAWMDKNQPDNEELKRFRAEAEEVLGIANGE